MGFSEKMLRHLPSVSPSTALPSLGPAPANIHTPPKKNQK